MNARSNLPLLILHSLSLEPKHGYKLARDIKQRSDGVLSVAEGTLYPALHDLEKQGLIASYEEEVRGRTRRSYRLTTAGEAALSTEREQWEQYVTAMRNILEGGPA